MPRRFPVRVALLATLLLTLLPAVGHAQLVLAPGDVETDLIADAGEILDECADTATETCTVIVSAGTNTIQMLASAEALGDATASAVLTKDFSILPSSSGNPDPLTGSLVSARVDRLGLLEALVSDASASSRVDIQVINQTIGALVGAAEVADQAISNGSLNVKDLDTVVIPVPLQRGHSYRIRIVVDGEAHGGLVVGAESDFLNLAGGVVVSELTVVAGADAFAAIRDLQDEVDKQGDEISDIQDELDLIQLELDLIDAELDEIQGELDDLGQELEDLEGKVDDLEEAFENHSHTYLTGRGTGHNNTEATTTRPNGAEAPEQLPVDDGEAVDDGEEVDDDQDGPQPSWVPRPPRRFRPNR